MAINSNLEFIYRLGDETRKLSEPEDIMAAVAIAVGRYLSVSRCAYADVEPDSNSFTIHRDYTDNCPSTAGKYELIAFGERAVDLLRQGETLVIHNVDAELENDNGGDTFRAIGIQAIVCCSLVKNGRLLAMMALHQIEPRQWLKEEVALMREVVERCWSTIERARAQKIALRSEKQFKDFFEYAPDAQVLIDRKGIIKLSNRRFASMFNIEPEISIGMPAVALLPAFIVESDVLSIESELDMSGSLSKVATQFKIENSAGKKFYVEISQNAIETDDGVLRALSIRDVSDRIQLEAELRQSKKIETVGLLAGGIAHDFNNLLTVIIGTSELALHKVESDSNIRKELETIRRVGSKAGNLTQQLLAFSRQQVLQPEVIDLNSSLLKSRDIIGRLIGENIAIVMNLEPDLQCVNLDLTQIEQVMMNLAANARDAMPEGGTLSITTRNIVELPNKIQAGNSLKRGYVLLQISDNGIGMSGTELERIFDPFFTTKDTGKGTGLGLSTVYGIVTQSDGYITVESSPNEGTEFAMYFPSVYAVPVTNMDKDKSACAMAKEKILVVEDEPALRDVLNELLQRCGYVVEAAVDGLQALELFARKPEYFDLILTDVIMPVMSGPKLIEEVRKIRPEVKVLFTSGYTADAIGRHGVLDGDQNFLSKPYRYEELQAIIRKVLVK